MEEYYNDSRPDQDWGHIITNKFSVNHSKNHRFFVIDDFYNDPDAVRWFALNQMYYPDEGAVGFRTRKQFLFDGVREVFEQAVGARIPDHTESGFGWLDAGINGRFQSCKAGTPSVFHCDSQKWAAVVYLTPDAPVESGTSFYRHKKSGVRHSTELDWNSDDYTRAFNQKTFLDGTPYEMIDTVGNVYNRAVIFDGGLIHSGVNYFGWDIASSRLFHIFFFDTE